MTRSFYLTPFALLVVLCCHAQSTAVNSDGTLVTIFNNGNASIQINPDGTHSHIIHNGNMSTLINPDGTHAAVFDNGNTPTQVIPNGMHMVIFYRGNSAATRLNPDGWYAIRLKPENLHCMYPDMTTDAAETDSAKLNYKKKLPVRKPFRR